MSTIQLVTISNNVYINTLLLLAGMPVLQTRDQSPWLLLPDRVVAYATGETWDTRYIYLVVTGHTCNKIDLDS